MGVIGNEGVLAIGVIVIGGVGYGGVLVKGGVSNVVC